MRCARAVSRCLCVQAAGYVEQGVFAITICKQQVSLSNPCIASRHPNPKPNQSTPNQPDPCNSQPEDAGQLNARQGWPDRFAAGRQQQ